jgi:hypothetical protein
VTARRWHPWRAQTPVGEGGWVWLVDGGRPGTAAPQHCVQQPADTPTTTYLVLGHAAGVGVVAAVGVLPGEVGDEQGGVQDKAHGVVDHLAAAEGLVAALVRDHPHAWGCSGAVAAAVSHQTTPAARLLEPGAGQRLISCCQGLCRQRECDQHLHSAAAGATARGLRGECVRGLR